MYLYEKLEREKKIREKEREEYLKRHQNEIKDPKYVSLMSSMSHTYGNVLAFIQNWVMDLFPENTFRTIHVNSKIAHRQIRSTDKEFLKKSKPMIIFRPRIGGVDEDVFLKDTAMIENQTMLYNTWGGTNLQPFFKDDERRLAIKYQMNRSVLTVDVILVFATLMQQIDYVHYLRNALRWDHPFPIETALESYLPQEFLSIIGELTHIPIYDPSGSTFDFLKYMNGHSRYPVTYKFNGASGSREFYRYYPAHVETTFSGLSWDDGEMNGFVSNQYQIDFSIRMEFYSTGLYYLFSDSIFDIPLPKPICGDNTDIIPIFTDVLLKEDLHLQPGWVLYSRGAVRLENPNDSLQFRSLINEQLVSAINYHLENSLPMVDLIDIKIRKQGKLITEGTEYTIDYKNETIHFINQDEYHTYSIYICVNLEYVNSLIKTLYNLT